MAHGLEDGAEEHQSIGGEASLLEPDLVGMDPEGGLGIEHGADGCGEGRSGGDRLETETLELGQEPGRGRIRGDDRGGGEFTERFLNSHQGEAGIGEGVALFVQHDDLPEVFAEETPEMCGAFAHLAGELADVLIFGRIPVGFATGEVDQGEFAGGGGEEPLEDFAAETVGGTDDDLQGAKGVEEVAEAVVVFGGGVDGLISAGASGGALERFRGSGLQFGQEEIVRAGEGSIEVEIHARPGGGSSGGTEIEGGGRLMGHDQAFEPGTRDAARIEDAAGHAAQDLDDSGEEIGGVRAGIVADEDEGGMLFGGGFERTRISACGLGEGVFAGGEGRRELGLDGGGIAFPEEACEGSGELSGAFAVEFVEVDPAHAERSE